MKKFRRRRKLPIYFNLHLYSHNTLACNVWLINTQHIDDWLSDFVVISASIDAEQLSAIYVRWWFNVRLSEHTYDAKKDLRGLWAMWECLPETNLFDRLHRRPTLRRALIHQRIVSRGMQNGYAYVSILVNWICEYDWRKSTHAHHLDGKWVAWTSSCGFFMSWLFQKPSNSLERR